MAAPPRPRTRNEIEVALICALQIESDAVEAMFDGHWADQEVHLGKAQGDQNSYTTGWICRHNVVLAFMARMGKVDAASVSASLRMSFPGIRLCLLVGICGGVPTGSGRDEIMLGDVLISSSVVQFDFGSRYSDQFVPKDTIDESFGRPSQELRSFLHQISGKGGMKRLTQKTAIYLHELCALEDFEDSRQPGVESDNLYPPSYRHKHQDPAECEVCASCAGWDDPVCEVALKATCMQLGCDTSQALPRRRVQQIQRKAAKSDHPPTGTPDLQKPIVKTQPVIYFGAIGSSDMVMKSGRDRDKVATAKDVIGFEMEGAGVSRNMPTLVVKSVCDYADSHKNKDWQKYAAAAAAGCMKALLNEWQSSIMHPVPEHGGTSQNAIIGGQTHVTGRTRERSGTEKSCLRSLFFSDMNFRRHDINDPEPGTCQWLQEHSYYKTWQQNQHGLLWIRGKPGAGKSTLLKHEEIRCKEIFSSEVDHVVASFFFHGRGSALQRNSLGLFRALLHQILSQIPEGLTQLNKAYKNKCDTEGEYGSTWEWHVEELKAFLETLVLDGAELNYDGAPRRCILHLYIDALDEAGKETAVELVAYFQRLVSHAVTSPTNLLICFTCRHYPIITLNTGLTINLEEQNYQDIKKYVERELQEEMANRLEANMVSQNIVAKSNGVFQWVVLVVHRVRSLHVEGVGLRRMLNVIEETPLGLHALYASLLNSINKADLAESKKLLRWICYALEPLHVDDLKFALSFDEENAHRSIKDCQTSETFWVREEEAKRRINTLSAGLVETKQNIVQVIHQSVRDHLILHAPQYLICHPEYSIQGEAHFHLARSCIAYLLADNFHEIPQVSSWQGLDDIPFWQIPKGWTRFKGYALANWETHALQAGLGGVPPNYIITLFGWPLSARMKEFLTLNHSFRARFRGHGYLPIFPANLLHLSAASGLSNVAEMLLEGDGKDYIKERDAEGRTAFYLAIQNEHQDLALLLLEKETPIQTLQASTERHTQQESSDHKTGPISYWKLVLKAAAIGRSMESLSLAPRKPQPNVRGVNIAQGDPATPLPLSADCRLVNVADTRGRTPILQAAASRSLLNIKLLLQRDDILLNVVDKSGNTAISHAVRSGCDSISQQLLARKELHVNVIDSAGRTPISYAAASKSVEITRMLLDRDDVLVNVVDSVGRTPISYAAASKSVDNTRMLLDRDDVLVNVVDSVGRTPIFYAVASMSVEITRMLLDRDDVLVNLVDSAGRTPLTYAVTGKNVEITRMLLGRDDILINGPDPTTITPPLIFAARLRKTDIVRRFLERSDILVNYVNSTTGYTPLSSAAEAGNTEILRLFLDRNDIQVNLATITGRTPLSCAAKAGHVEIVRLFLERSDILVNQNDLDGATPLWYAVTAGRTEIVRLFLDRNDIQVNLTTISGRTPLSCAAKAGHVEIVRLFLERSDILVNQNDLSGIAPLLYAAEAGNFEVVQLLLERKDTIVNQAHPSTGRTPLSFAAESGTFKVVRLFFERKDTLVNQVDFRGRTPLSWAVEVGNAKLVRLFLERKDILLNVVDSEGHTPIYRAIRGQWWGVASLLLDCDNIDLNFIDERGRTPISYLAEYDDGKLLTQIVERDGVELNIPDRIGRTPLSYAAGSGTDSVDKCSNLLKTGKIQINLADNRGYTALWWAQGRADAGAFALLEKHGASMEPGEQVQASFADLSESDWHEGLTACFLTRRSP